MSVSVYFLKPINYEAVWRERKTQHGRERLFFQINGQISDSIISTSTYQNTHKLWVEEKDTDLKNTR